MRKTFITYMIKIVNKYSPIIKFAVSLTKMDNEKKIRFCFRAWYSNVFIIHSIYDFVFFIIISCHGWKNGLVGH